MSRFLNKAYQSMDVYKPGEQPKDKEYIRLNTNESPFPPSPEVLAAVNSSEVEQLRLYPDHNCTNLKEKLADLYDVTPENIYLSNGSDDTLLFSFMAFAGYGRKVVFPEITYDFYQVFADLTQSKWEKKPLCDDYTIDNKDFFNAGGLVVIANPNAPTGLTLGRREIIEIIENNKDNVVLIDEAYVDFGGESVVDLTKVYDNLMVVQTFSKSRSMAGARLGFGIANADLIADLDRIKFSTNPYNINRLTLAAGEAAIDSNDYYMENCKEIIRVRDYTAAALRDMGFFVIPSNTNFVFAKSPKIGGQALYDELKARGVLVRHLAGEKIEDFNRIAIGTKEQMDIFLAAVKDILK